MSLSDGWLAAASWAILPCMLCMSMPGVKVPLMLRPNFWLMPAIMAWKPSGPPKLSDDHEALKLPSFLAPSTSAWRLAIETGSGLIAAGFAGAEAAAPAEGLAVPDAGAAAALAGAAAEDDAGAAAGA